MGHIFADIQLTNPRKPDLKALSVRALADTGALMLCLPEHIAIQLELETESLREVTVVMGVPCRFPLWVPSRLLLTTASASSAPWSWVMKCGSARSPWTTWIWC